MAIGEVVPKDDGEPAGNVAVEFATGFVGGAVVDVALRKVSNGLEAREEEFAIALAQLAGELKNERVEASRRFTPGAAREIARGGS